MPATILQHPAIKAAAYLTRKYRFDSGDVTAFYKCFLRQDDMYPGNSLETSIVNNNRASKTLFQYICRLSVRHASQQVKLSSDDLKGFTDFLNNPKLFEEKEMEIPTYCPVRMHYALLELKSETSQLFVRSTEKKLEFMSAIKDYVAPLDKLLSEYGSTTGDMTDAEHLLIRTLSSFSIVMNEISAHHGSDLQMTWVEPRSFF